MWQVASLVSLTAIFQYGIPRVAATLTPTCPDPVAYYPLDGQHLTEENQNRTLPLEAFGLDDSPLAPGPDGTPNGSYRFNGTRQALFVFSSPGDVLNVQSSITFLCWVYFIPDPPESAIQSLMGYTQSGALYNVGLFYIPANPIIVWSIVQSDGTESFVAANALLPSFSWTHIGATYDGVTGEARLFLNGSVIAMETFPPNIQLQTQDLFFTVANALTGQIAQVRVYDIALRERQVRAVYQPSVYPCPIADVRCGENGSHIVITINNVPDLPEWIAAGGEDEWRLNGGSANACRPSFNETTAVYGPFVGSDCANITSSIDYFIYAFQITAQVDGNSPIRRYDHNYIGTCNYSRNGTVSSSFQSLQKLEDFEVGTTDFTFNMQLFRDEDHTQIITGTVYLNEIVYVRVSVTHMFGEQIDLLLEYCYTSTDEDGTNDVHDLIGKSCATGDEPTLSYSCENQTGASEEFSLRAFRYAGAEPGDSRSSVWFHCEVYACLSSNSSSVCQGLCDNGCFNDRRRRNAGELQGDAYEQKVSAGPFRFVDREQGEQDTTQDESHPQAKVPAELTVIISVSGVVAMAIVWVTVFLVIRIRRRNVPVTEIATTAPENPVCEAADFDSKI